MRHGVLPCRQLTSILHGPDEFSTRTSHSHHPLPQLTRPCCPLPEFHRCKGALHIHVQADQQRDQAKLPEHITTKLTRLYNTDQINIICVLLWLSINIPAVSHSLLTPCFATKSSMHFSNMCTMCTAHLILFDLIILVKCGKGKDHEASPYAIFLITQHNQNLFSLAYC